jgi:hypothetical protein
MTKAANWFAVSTSRLKHPEEIGFNMISSKMIGSAAP